MLVALPPTLLQQCRERLKMFGFHPSFSRHGITRASSVLLIWLNENVLIIGVLRKNLGSDYRQTFRHF